MCLISRPKVFRNVTYISLFYYFTNDPNFKNRYKFAFALYGLKPNLYIYSCHGPSFLLLSFL